MKLIPIKVHGYLDYIVGLLLMWVPVWLNYTDYGAQGWVPVILGVITVGYSFLTRYALGVIKLIPVHIHFLLDLLSALILLFSPWLFHFADQIWFPYVLVGIIEIGVISFTEPYIPPVKRHHRRHVHRLTVRP